jgi:mitosis inhibitor protein kinase SWE1
MRCIHSNCGPVTRNRLREEVDVLKALADNGGHANVLEYVDSWDEDDHLYIQTTLCPMGNLATFLNEYGKNFDRLDEAYIWKIMADVADVSGHTLRLW